MVSCYNSKGTEKDNNLLGNFLAQTFKAISWCSCGGWAHCGSWSGGSNLTTGEAHLELVDCRLLNLLEQKSRLADTVTGRKSTSKLRDETVDLITGQVELRLQLGRNAKMKKVVAITNQFEFNYTSISIPGHVRFQHDGQLANNIGAESNDCAGPDAILLALALDQHPRLGALHELIAQSRNVENGPDGIAKLCVLKKSQVAGELSLDPHQEQFFLLAQHHGWNDTVIVLLQEAQSSKQK